LPEIVSQLDTWHGESPHT